MTVRLSWNMIVKMMIMIHLVLNSYDRLWLSWYWNTNFGSRYRAIIYCCNYSLLTSILFKRCFQTYTQYMCKMLFHFILGIQCSNFLKRGTKLKAWACIQSSLRLLEPYPVEQGWPWGNNSQRKMLRWKLQKLGHAYWCKKCSYLPYTLQLLVTTATIFVNSFYIGNNFHSNFFHRNLCSFVCSV